MSYRDPDQSLEEPIENIVEGIDKFKSAAMERIKSNSWSKEHMLELRKFIKSLTDIKIDLEFLSNETW